VPAASSPGADGGSAIVDLHGVMVAVTNDAPRILTVHRDGSEALPSGPLDPERDRTLEVGVRRWVRERTGLELGYAEQLYTLGNRGRDPREQTTGKRVLALAYLALMREQPVAGHSGVSWRDWYPFFPWEDWRAGPPAVLVDEIVPALLDWTAAPADRALRRRRGERVELTFGLHGARWDGERVLDRYELLYEAGLVGEAARDRPEQPPSGPFGRPMALDHRRIAAIALGRLRGKLRYRPVIFELLPPTFTLSQLQHIVEALSGVRLHTQNFRRFVERGGLVEGTGELERGTGGRPAVLFRFRREVLRERPSPGVGLPTAPVQESRLSD
jgi:hypothetical protein